MTEAEKLKKIIHDIATSILEREPYTGGCRTFYTQGEWRARKEGIGDDALLVVVHDGGEYADIFGAYGFHRHQVIMQHELMKHGYFAEGIYHWATGIYKL
jgi:hypothetical protein